MDKLKSIPIINSVGDKKSPHYFYSNNRKQVPYNCRFIVDPNNNLEANHLSRLM